MLHPQRHPEYRASLVGQQAHHTDTVTSITFGQAVCFPGKLELNLGDKCLRSL